MVLQSSVSESHEGSEDDLSSLTWQEISARNNVVWEAVVQGITVEDEDKHPKQLLELAHDMGIASMKINSFKKRKHKENFERLLCSASCLVVVFWQLYITTESDPLFWPLPGLRKVLDELAETIFDVYRLMKRKSRENIARRVLEGFFGVRDIGKLKKYQRRLESVASGLEVRDHNTID